MVVEGLVGEDRLMGEYELMEGVVVNGRAVWQQKKDGNGGRRGDDGGNADGNDDELEDDGDFELFLYFAGTGEWIISEREDMEQGSETGILFLDAVTLTPDQPDTANPRPWRACADETDQTVGVRVRSAAAAAAAAAAAVQQQQQQQQ
jgi:hypothetical protein